MEAFVEEKIVFLHVLYFVVLYIKGDCQAPGIFISAPVSSPAGEPVVQPPT